MNIKIRIGKSISKRKQHFLMKGVKITVSHIDILVIKCHRTFLIADAFIFPGTQTIAFISQNVLWVLFIPCKIRRRRIILIFGSNRHRELSRWIDFSCQDVRHCPATLFPWYPHEQHTLYHRIPLQPAKINQTVDI